MKEARHMLYDSINMKYPERQIHRDRKQISGCQGWSRGEIGSDCLMGMEFPFGVMKKLWNWIVVMVAKHCECTFLHFKYVQFTECQLYLSKDI